MIETASTSILTPFANMITPSLSFFLNEQLSTLKKLTLFNTSQETEC